MYESFFHLQSRPFAAAPVVEAYFPARSIEQARQTLIRTVDRAEGPGLVIGQAGTGKSLLLRVLADHFRNVFHFVHLSSARVSSRKDLLQSVLFELDLPYRDMDEGELRLSLLDFLRPSDFCPHGILLLVDEAHTLPLRLLDEVRMITNMLSDGEPRVRLVLAGDMRLDERFAHPKLTSFNQRVAARCYLEALGRDETVTYVQAHIAAVGGNPHAIFSDDALVAIFQATDGIPRLINQVCDHALVMARLGGCSQVNAAGVEEAWADLQQLPGPWNVVPSQESQESSIVEFGVLDGDDEPDEAADEDQPLLHFDARRLAEHSRAASASDEPRQAESAAAEPPLSELPREPVVEDQPAPVAAPLAARPADIESDQHFASAHQALDTIEAALAAHEKVAAEPPRDPRLMPFQQSVFQFGWPEGEDRRIEVAFESPAQPAVPETTLQKVRVEDPFGDGFEQEELVIDRYASLDAHEHPGGLRVFQQDGADNAESTETLQPPPQANAVEHVDPITAATPSPLETLPLGATSNATPDTVPDAQPCPENTRQGTFECAAFEGARDGDDMAREEPNIAAFTPSPAVGADAALPENTAPDVFVDDGSDPTNEIAALANFRSHTIRWPDRTANVSDDRDIIVIDGPESEVDDSVPDDDEQESARRVDYHELFAQLRQR